MLCNSAVRGGGSEEDDLRDGFGKEQGEVCSEAKYSKGGKGLWFSDNAFCFW